MPDPVIREAALDAMRETGAASSLAALTLLLARPHPARILRLHDGMGLSAGVVLAICRRLNEMFETLASYDTLPGKQNCWCQLNPAFGLLCINIGSWHLPCLAALPASSGHHRLHAVVNLPCSWVGAVPPVLRQGAGIADAQRLGGGGGRGHAGWRRPDRPRRPTAHPSQQSRGGGPPCLEAHSKSQPAGLDLGKCLLPPQLQAHGMHGPCCRPRQRRFAASAVQVVKQGAIPHMLKLVQALHPEPAGALLETWQPWCQHNRLRMVSVLSTGTSVFVGRDSPGLREIFSSDLGCSESQTTNLALGCMMIMQVSKSLWHVLSREL